MPLLPRSDPNAVPKGPPLLLVWVIGLVIITVCIIYYLFRDFLQEVISMWHRIRFNQRVKRAIQNGGVVLLLPSSSGTSGQAALRTRPILHELRLGDGNMRTEITKTDSVRHPLSPLKTVNSWSQPKSPLAVHRYGRLLVNQPCEHKIEGFLRIQHVVNHMCTTQRFNRNLLHGSST